MRGALGGRARRMDDVGSTSVPRLKAQPIIDVLLVVADSGDEQSYARHSSPAADPHPATWALPALAIIWPMACRTSELACPRISSVVRRRTMSSTVTAHSCSRA